METHIIKEGVLNDDMLYLADCGKVFKGGYIAQIEQYTYRNAWSNDLTVKKFRSEEALNKFLLKFYPDFNF